MKEYRPLPLLRPRADRLQQWWFAGRQERLKSLAQSAKVNARAVISDSELIDTAQLVSYRNNRHFGGVCFKGIKDILYKGFFIVLLTMLSMLSLFIWTFLRM